MSRVLDFVNQQENRSIEQEKTEPLQSCLTDDKRPVENKVKVSIGNASKACMYLRVKSY